MMKMPIIDINVLLTMKTRKEKIGVKKCHLKMYKGKFDNQEAQLRLKNCSVKRHFINLLGHLLGAKQ